MGSIYGEMPSRNLVGLPKNPKETHGSGEEVNEWKMLRGTYGENRTLGVELLGKTQFLLISVSKQHLPGHRDFRSPQYP